MVDISLSLITPAYNNAEEVMKLIESARAEASMDSNFELIVIDDCSKDDSIRLVSEKAGYVRYLRMDKNSGPAAARNAGARIAKNDIIVFLDSDVILNSDTLSRVKDRFRTDEKISILGGEYDIEPANPSLGTKFKSLMVRSWMPSGNTVTVFLTRLGAIKRDIFNELGGFDINLRTASVEDYEFGRRLMEKGYTIYYDPDITVKHHFPPFRKQVELFFHRAFMWIYVFKRHGKFDNTCTTPMDGVSQVFGFLSTISLMSGLLYPNLMYPGILFLLLFIITDYRFFKLTLKNEGFVFTLEAIPMALIISCSIVLGSAWGVVYYFLCNNSLGKKVCAGEDSSS